MKKHSLKFNTDFSDTSSFSAEAEVLFVGNYVSTHPTTIPQRRVPRMDELSIGFLEDCRNKYPFFRDSIDEELGKREQAFLVKTIQAI